MRKRGHVHGRVRHGFIPHPSYLTPSLFVLVSTLDEICSDAMDAIISSVDSHETVDMADKLLARALG